MSDRNALLRDIKRGCCLRKTTTLVKNSISVDLEITKKRKPATKEITMSGDVRDRSNLLELNGCDFVLRYQDEDIGFHGVFLMGQSGYFDCIIDTDCSERTLRTIELGPIDGVTVTHLRIMIQYMYGKPLNNINIDALGGLYAAAKYFQINKLKQTIQQMVKKIITKATTLIELSQYKILHSIIDYENLELDVDSKQLSELLSFQYPDLDFRCGEQLASTEEVTWSDLKEFSFNVTRGFFSSQTILRSSLGGFSSEDDVLNSMIKFSTMTELDLSHQRELASQLHLHHLSREGVIIAKEWEAVHLNNLISSLCDRVFSKQNSHYRCFPASHN